MKLIRSDIYENLKMAIETLRDNKLRSFLTVLGVVIGVVTVMAIASIISGIDYAVTKQIESFGTNSIFVTEYESGVRFGPPTREERMRKSLTYEDAMAIAQLPAISQAVPLLNITNDYFGRKISVKAVVGRSRRRSICRGRWRSMRTQGSGFLRRADSSRSQRTTVGIPSV
jgi:putative ABC transport system permease protein